MRRGPTGQLVTLSAVGGESVRAFVPEPLPPQPAVAPDPSLRDALDTALVALGRLDSVAALLPDTQLFLYSYVRREAVLSSQIEGTQSSLSDLLLFELDEAPGVPLGDVAEVSSHVAALEHGLARLREGFPLSNRLIREIHGVLLSKGRGAEKQPGEFRRSQSWIAGTRPGNAAFVPPPPDRVADCMGDLERPGDRFGPPRPSRVAAAPAGDVGWPGWVIREEKPVALDDDSEPEPDLAVVPGTHRDYSSAHPARPVLVVEVAESSLAWDRGDKGSLYARARIADYWIVNLIDRVLEVYRNPAPDPLAPHGWRYGSAETFAPPSSVSPESLPDAHIPVAGLLP